MRTFTKLITTSAAALAMSALMAGAASATVYIGNWTQNANGSITVLFGDSGIGSPTAALKTFYDTEPSDPNFGKSDGAAAHTVTGSGNNRVFTDTFLFALPTGYLGGTGSTHHSTRSGAAANLVFTGLTFNGVPGEYSNYAFGWDDTPITKGGMQTLVIKGKGGPTASYAGTITFTPVPEPVTWALMLAGFATMGAMLRRRARGAFALS